MAITFANPPISEVAIGLGFLPRTDFLIPHFGEFWNSIRDLYPKTAHASPVATGNSLVQDAFGLVLPRVWFVSEDDCQVVQVQQDQLFANWRQSQQNATYPRFPTIRDEFLRLWELFSQFLQEKTGTAPQPFRAELAYVNAIPLGEGWNSIADLGGVLRDFRWHTTDRYLPGPSRFANHFEFSLPDGTTLSAKVAMGVRVTDRKEVLRLELNAACPILQGADIPDWFERSHEAIVKAFKDLTTDEMHTSIWQLQEE